MALEKRGMVRHHAKTGLGKHYVRLLTNCIICMMCFTVLFALGPKSTAMVMAGLSVHLTKLFPGQA